MYLRASLVGRKNISYLQRSYNPYLKKFRKNMNDINQTKVNSKIAPSSVITDRNENIVAVSSSSVKPSISTSQISAPLYKPIVWIDCEMTGLDHINDHIIEICCIITDGKLNIVDEDGYENVIHYGKEIMDTMGEWCIQHHGESGLTKKVIESTNTREHVEQELLAYIKKWIPEPRKGILAGNSVHMDRLFMLREFPSVTDYLFYRIIDVSTIMEVSHRHNPQLAKVIPRKKNAHTAKADILESISQLKFYQQHYLKNEVETQAFVNKRRAEILAEQQYSTTAQSEGKVQGTKRPTESHDATTPGHQSEKKLKQ